MVVSRRTDGAHDPAFEEVLRDAAAGGEWGFAQLFRTWNAPLSAFVGGRGADDVDDVVNEIFLGAFRSIARFSGTESDFRAWMFRIARNKLADHFRLRGRRPATIALPDGFDPVGGDAEAEGMATLERSELVRLLATLTDDQAEVLLLRIVADLTIAEIATVVGKSEGAVKAHQRRGLDRLRRELAERVYPQGVDRTIARLT